MDGKEIQVFAVDDVIEEFSAVFKHLNSSFNCIQVSSNDLESGKCSSPNAVILCSDRLNTDRQNEWILSDTASIFILQRHYARHYFNHPCARRFLVFEDNTATAEILADEMGKAINTGKAYSELTASNKQLKTLVYSITHDLRAPLMSLLGLIEVAKDDNTLERKEVFRLFKRSIGRMDEHIKTTLDYYRNQSDELNYSDIDIPHLINGIVDMHRNYNEVVKFDLYHKGQTSACTDPLRVRIALFNLISNAIKYGNKGKGNYLVKIDSNCDHRQLVIKVSDYGPGIDPKDHKRIFNQFVLGSESEKSTGLGLYLTQDAMYRIGGKVILQSKPGQGATFTLEIPNHQKD